MVREAHFDEAIHALTRLRLCALLRPLAHAEFSVLRSELDVSEANLSKTIRQLVEIGYLQTAKRTSADRPDARLRTTVAMTRKGRRAFDGHLAALRALEHEDERER